jgi:hypothetical protein
MFDIPEVKRRSAPRRMARLSCEAVAADGFVRIGGTLRDLSDTGMLLESEVSLAPGEEIYLSFCLPRSTQWVGLVARVQRASRPIDGPVCLAGLVIEDIDPVERSLLVAAVERLPMHPQKRKAPRDYAAWVAQVSGVTDLSAIQSW